MARRIHLEVGEEVRLRVALFAHRRGCGKGAEPKRGRLLYRVGKRRGACARLCHETIGARREGVGRGAWQFVFCLRRVRRRCGERFEAAGQRRRVFDRAARSQGGDGSGLRGRDRLSCGRRQARSRDRRGRARDDGLAQDRRVLSIDDGRDPPRERNGRGRKVHRRRLHRDASARGRSASDLRRRHDGGAKERHSLRRRERCRRVRKYDRRSDLCRIFVKTRRSSRIVLWYGYSGHRLGHGRTIRRQKVA